MSRHKSHVSVRLAGPLALLVVSCGSVDQSSGLIGSGGLQVSVNEILPSNQSTPDPDESSGLPEFDDWIELYNAGNKEARLEGYFITDNPDRPFKQVLPAEAVVPAHGFLILWADRQPDQGPLHLAFALSRGGEGVWLSDPDGNFLDGTAYGSAPARGYDLNDNPYDYSYARFPDGTGAFQWCGKATQAATNGNTCVVSP